MTMTVPSGFRVSDSQSLGDGLRVFGPILLR